ncbi:hypothetical protein V495_01561 [Pseudogymnoascus sp. VKM F-4514 (FW-929)]|nr:hypothetical protein V495_01561 [Pseudogymnoascus sp. VKM F-4514 (FW-929)]
MVNLGVVYGVRGVTLTCDADRGYNAGHSGQELWGLNPNVRQYEGLAIFKGTPLGCMRCGITATTLLLGNTYYALCGLRDVLLCLTREKRRGGKCSKV